MPPVTFVPMPAVDADLALLRTDASPTLCRSPKGLHVVPRRRFYPGEDHALLRERQGSDLPRAAQRTGVWLDRVPRLAVNWGGRCRNTFTISPVRTRFCGKAPANMTGSVGQKRVPCLAGGRSLAPPFPACRAEADCGEGGGVAGARERGPASGWRRSPRSLKRFRQSVLAAACSGELSADWRTDNGDDDKNRELPAFWEQATVGDAIDGLKYGTSKKCEYARKGVPVLRIPNIGDGVISRDDLKYADLELTEYKQLRLQPGDLLMIRSNGMRVTTWKDRFGWRG